MVGKMMETDSHADFKLVPGVGQCYHLKDCVYQVETWKKPLTLELYWIEIFRLTHKDKRTVFPEVLLLMLTNFKPSKCPLIREKWMNYISNLE